MYCDDPALTHLPIIISCPRSGLNWVRYCVEKLIARPTPGLTVLVDNKDASSWAFLRTHDAKNIGIRKESHAWDYVPPQAFRERKVILLLRDPREIVARIMTIKRSFNQIPLLYSNINYFFENGGCNNNIFYYEEFTRSSIEMKKLLINIGLISDDRSDEFGKILDSDWADMQRDARRIYSINQKKGGGSITINDPDNMKFHQERVNPEVLHRYWENILSQLSPASLAAMARYID